MSKCHVAELKRLYAKVLEDIAYAYPTLRSELSKDLARIQRGLEQRGLHAACVDLPALGKHLDRCVSEGQYILSGLPFARKMSKSVPIPKLLGGLYLLVFEPSGALKGEPDVVAYAMLRQVLYLAKAARLRCGDDAIRAEMHEFVKVDANLPPPEEFWTKEEAVREDVEATYAGFQHSELYTSRVRGFPVERQGRLSAFLANLDVVSGLVATTLGPYSYGEWSFKHGPGAIAEECRPSNKYNWLGWCARLEREFPIADCGYSSYRSWVDKCNGLPFCSRETTDCVDHDYGCDLPSRMVAVPKTFTKPRLIACETSARQWCQQNIWHYLSSRTEQTWLGKFIWFKDQSRNREMCRRGSVDGAVTTVDLKTASDCVTCHVVGQLFRRNPGLLLALQATRAHEIWQELANDLPTLVKLNKFSTMGSACTFPVETLVFFCIAVSAVLTQRRLRPVMQNILALTEEVTIFGDDMIVPTESRELLFDALECLHFKVNTAKTFWNGNFRESCGLDAFRGIEVTPVKWKGIYSDDSESYTSTLDVANNFYSKFFVATSAYLDSTIQGGLPPLVPVTSEYVGRRSFVNPVSVEAPKLRWNQDLQRKEFWVPVITTRVSKTPVDGNDTLLQYFTEAPSPYDKWRGGYTGRPTTARKWKWVAERSFCPQGSGPDQ